jgi:hypothetical protein
MLLSRKKGTPRTEILNSLNIAETILHNEKKRDKILVILSDMIQDSREYNFKTAKITNGYIQKVIRYRQRQKLIPNLTGVKVYVAGASGEDSYRFRSIEKFWARYLAGPATSKRPVQITPTIVTAIPLSSLRNNPRGNMAE